LSSFVGPAFSAATSCVTILLMSSPEPSPVDVIVPWVALADEDAGELALVWLVGSTLLIGSPRRPPSN
jgi:hypothetical protein